MESIDGRTILGVLAGAVFVMMVVLALLKHQTRKRGLLRFQRRYAGRKRFVAIARPPPPDEPPDSK